MKIADLKPGMIVLYSTAVNGPLGGNSYGRKETYHEVEVIEPEYKYPQTHKYDQEPWFALLVNQRKKGVVIKRRNAERAEVVQARFLYDITLAEADARWAKRDDEAKAHRAQRKAEAQAKYERQQALVDRIRALGITVSAHSDGNRMPFAYGDGSMTELQLGPTTIEALLEKAENPPVMLA